MSGGIFFDLRAVKLEDYLRLVVGGLSHPGRTALKKSCTNSCEQPNDQFGWDKMYYESSVKVIHFVKM